MRKYSPPLPFNVPFALLKPTEKTTSGVLQKIYPTIEQALDDHSNIIYGSFITYGGTEHDVNGIYSIEDTANVDTWYRSDIKSNCRIAKLDNSAIYEIINEPEDIDQRHQFLKFKVRRVKGGA